MKVIWKTVRKDGGNIYQVSNLGKVRCIFFPKIQKWGRKGYERIHYGGSQILVHRLVAEAFLPNEKRLKIVNHIDHNRLNNEVSNLEWVTQSDNVYKSFSRTIDRNGYASCIQCGRKTSSVSKKRNLCRTCTKQSKEISCKQL